MKFTITFWTVYLLMQTKITSPSSGVFFTWLRPLETVAGSGAVSESTKVHSRGERKLFFHN